MGSLQKPQYKPDITKKEIRGRISKDPLASLGGLVGLVPTELGWDNSIPFCDLEISASYLSPNGHLVRIFHRDRKTTVYKCFFPGERGQTRREDTVETLPYYPVSVKQLVVLQRVWKDSLDEGAVLQQGDEIRGVLVAALENGPVNIKEFAEKYSFPYSAANVQRKRLEEVDRIIVKAGRGTYKLKE